MPKKVNETEAKEGNNDRDTNLVYPLVGRRRKAELNSGLMKRNYFNKPHFVFI